MNTSAKGLVLILALAASGCVSTDAAHKDALRRFGECGQAVVPMLKPPANDGEAAVQEAFKMCVDEAIKVR